MRQAIALALAFVSAVATIWLNAEHVPGEAMRVAQAFVDCLQAKEFAQAYELTVRNNGFVGATPAEFERIAQRQSCKVRRLVGTFPAQSNGNRLRR